MSLAAPALRVDPVEDIGDQAYALDRVAKAA
jgi:hypothetical protein